MKSKIFQPQVDALLAAAADTDDPALRRVLEAKASALTCRVLNLPEPAGAPSKKEAREALLHAGVRREASAKIEAVWRLFKRGSATSPVRLDSIFGTFDVYCDNDVAVGRLGKEVIMRMKRDSLKNALSKIKSQ